MSRPNTKGLRDMSLPTIADLRGAVEEARAHCLDAEQAETFCDDAVDQMRRLWRRELAVAGVQIIMLVATAVILVTR